MSFRDFLSNIGPIVTLKIPLLGRLFGRPRVEIDVYQAPDQDMLDRMRKAEGKQDETK